MDRQDLKEGQEVYVKGRVIHTGDHLDIVLDEGSFIENAIVLHHEKPVVPQFVAEWYEKRKNSLEFNIFDYVYRFDQKEESDLKNWFNDINTNPFQTLVNMHQFGYEVEKEKQYLVKIKSTGQCLGKYYINNEVLSPRFIYTGRNADAFTRKELEEAGFGWVFDCEGVEIEEEKE